MSERVRHEPSWKGKLQFNLKSKRKKWKPASAAYHTKIFYLYLLLVTNEETINIKICIKLYYGEMQLLGLMVPFTEHTACMCVALKAPQGIWQKLHSWAFLQASRQEPEQPQNAMAALLWVCYQKKRPATTFSDLSWSMIL